MAGTQIKWSNGKETNFFGSIEIDTYFEFIGNLYLKLSDEDVEDNAYNLSKGETTTFHDNTEVTIKKITIQVH